MDGKLDLISGDSDGQVWLFLNIGTREEPKLAEGARVEAGGVPICAAQRSYQEVDGEYVLDSESPASHELADDYSKIHFADWNGDGLRDLLIGHNSTVVFYENSGSSAAPRFEEPELLELPGKCPSRPSPYVVDWDGDGVRDLLLGTERPQIFYYRNEGSDEEPELAEGEALVLSPEEFHAGYRCRIEVTDWNEDGELDLLIGNRYRASEDDSGGNVWLFLGK